MPFRPWQLTLNNLNGCNTADSSVLGATSTLAAAMLLQIPSLQEHELVHAGAGVSIVAPWHGTAAQVLAEPWQASPQYPGLCSPGCRMRASEVFANTWRARYQHECDGMLDLGTRLASLLAAASRHEMRMCD